MLGALLDAFIAVDFLVNWGLGWRYVLSPTFRARVHSRWRQRSRAAVAAEATFCAISFFVLNTVLVLFVVLVVAWLYRDVVLRHLGT